MRTVTGEASAALGEAEVEVGLGRLRICHKVLVADIDYDFIMGMDHIGKYGLSYDPELRTLKFGNESFAIYLPGGEVTSVGPYYVFETIQIKGL